MQKAVQNLSLFSTEESLLVCPRSCCLAVTPENGCRQTDAMASAFSESSDRQRTGKCREVHANVTLD